MAESQGDRYASLFASYAHTTRWEQLPEATVHEIKRRVLDSIGVAMAAFDEDAPTAARAYALELPHASGATLWGTDARVAPEAASLANGVMVRYLDFNDTYLSKEPLHPSDVIPGLIALCQWRNRPVRDLIAGVAVAYEIGVDLCDSASLRARGWDHVNYIAVAAACGAGTLLGLSPSADRACHIHRHCAPRLHAPDQGRRAFDVEGGRRRKLHAQRGLRRTAGGEGVHRAVSAVPGRDGLPSPAIWGWRTSTARPSVRWRKALRRPA